ncbi:MAG: hypothetical protein U9N33_09950 [Campylobacterota bacterium]|nr:hypothetical protein [Campylobacterota bacterium]
MAHLPITPCFIVESELELNKGFADKQTIEKLKTEAINQLNRYEDDTLVTTYTKDGVKLKKVVLIFHGWELMLCEEVEDT